MAEKSSYKTANRAKILKYIQDNRDRAVTVSDIDSYLKDENSGVNITTIYRYLDKLTKEGKIIKYVAEKGGMTNFQYVENGHKCDEHLHLKCKECGGVIHLECSFMNEISKHINEHHNFSLQCKNSVIYGICKKCK